MILESGLTFLYGLRLNKSPNRKLYIPHMKMVMLQMYGWNSQGHYPRECLFWLLQQLFILSDREAHRAFHGSFVNTKGKIDTHVPADLAMEWQVRDGKQFAKHLYSNKNPHAVEKHSAAIPFVKEIGRNFDANVEVVQHYQSSGPEIPREDERILLEEVMDLDVFKHTEGRAHANYERMKRSPRSSVDGYKFQSFFTRWFRRFTPNL